MTRKSSTGIPGVTFSWKRAIGVSKVKQKIARKTGIPTTKNGLERKVGQVLIDAVKNLFTGK